jgi:phosphoglycerol geranylgeranyltransferase
MRMPSTRLYESILSARNQGKKQLAVLIDPDKTGPKRLIQLLESAVRAEVDYFFLGSSLLVNDRLEDCLGEIKVRTNIPAILFPGNAMQLSNKADGILLLSLISGRNPELLIGQHVVAAPYLRNSGLEILPTGYMLIDGGAPTSVSYMSNTQPIPADKTDIAICTAMAGEMLGLKMIYLDAGSGARQRISEEMIGEVRRAINVPLTVGGGIRSAMHAEAAVRAGADLIVVGNALEKNPASLEELTHAVHAFEPAPSDFSANGGNFFR